ncbi:hypothetical protein [Mammaliicoccus sciuri]|uniref:hypothetical protein n=1 Tax=Mammaliicoccus sciuri TaxID=1296 RepID=UPI003AE51475
MNNSEVISLLALLISGFTLFKVLWQEKKRLAIDIHNAFIFKNPKKFDIYISFSNSSKLPIAITKIEIYDRIAINSPCYKKANIKNIILSDIGNVEVLYTSSSKGQLTSAIYSNSLPINIAPYSSIKDIIRFDINENIKEKNIDLIESKDVIFVKIYTTRGIFWKSISTKDISIQSNPFDYYVKLKHHNKVSNKNID